MFPAHLIPLDSVPKSYLLRSTDHEASDLVVFTTPLSPHPSDSSICPSTPFLNIVGLCSFLSVTYQVLVKEACLPCNISILHLSAVYIMYILCVCVHIYIYIVWVMSLMLGNAVLRVRVRELAYEMEVCNVTGIPNTMSLRQWMSTGTWPSRTVTMKYGNTTIVVQLLAPSAKNVIHSWHSHSLLLSKGNAVNIMFMYRINM